MIDVQLINQAQEKSEVIAAIDSSWRSYVNEVRENIVTIPFKGSYSALIENNHVLVEGYCGLLLIDKMYFNHKTYILKNPVKHEPFRIYGVYDSKAQFESFVARPEIGFHYLGLSEHGHTICTGDVEYPSPDSLDSLKQASLKIMRAFRLINMESMGTIRLPDDYPKLKSIFSNNDDGSKTKIEKLLAEGLAEKIL